MKLWKKAILGSLAALLVGVVGYTVLLSLAFDLMCTNEVFGESLSPQRNLKTVVFERNCGATTGFSTHVSIMDAKEGVGYEGGNVFVIDGHPNDTGVVVRWIDDSQLEIFTPNLRGVFLAERSWGKAEVVVSYVQTGS